LARNVNIRRFHAGNTARFNWYRDVDWELLLARDGRVSSGGKCFLVGAQVSSSTGVESLGRILLLNKKPKQTEVFMIREEVFNMVTIDCEYKRLHDLQQDEQLDLKLWDLDVVPTEHPEFARITPRSLRGALAVLLLLQEPERPSTGHS
jgi:hypothetical protein